MTNYDPPWSTRSAYLGDVTRNKMLEPTRPAGTSFLARLAANALLDAPQPVPSLGTLLAANRLLNPPVNHADAYLRSILAREQTIRTQDESSNDSCNPAFCDLLPTATDAMLSLSIDRENTAHGTPPFYTL